MWRYVSQICVVVAAVLILTACSAAPPAIEAEPELEVGSLVAEGHSINVSSCVAGLADSSAREGTADDLIEVCERAEDMLNDPGDRPVVIQIQGPTTYGDDPRLDVLWDGCEAGDGAACDELWDQAPLDSEYEHFGVTCGGRDEVLHCAELSNESYDAGDDSPVDEEAVAD